MTGNYQKFARKLADKPMAKRFRGFLPIVVDVETGGINPSTHALLEIGAVTLHLDEHNKLVTGKTFHQHVKPAQGTKLDSASLEFNKIDPHHPLRFAVEEKEALEEFFALVEDELSVHNCQRSIIVAHNAWFDLHAILAASQRAKMKNNPFHSFSTIDTASLGALLDGQTVLARICQDWNIEHDPQQAHSALYDAQITADIFCSMVNSYHSLAHPQ